MMTTQIQVLLYFGSTQVVSCSIFVPVPAIVVKSHQTIEAILPLLPLSLSAPFLSRPEDSPHPHSTHYPDDDLPSPSHSQSLVLSSGENNYSTSSRHHHSHHSSSSSSSRRPRHRENRISPDCSIPSTTCIKISLQPTPTVKFVEPRPYRHHRSHRSHRHSQHRHHPNCPASNPSPNLNMAALEYPPYQPESSYLNQGSSPSSAETGALHHRTIRTTPVFFTFPYPTNGSLPATVQLTGTFNQWQRTIPLTPNPDASRFEAEFNLDLSSLPDHPQHPTVGHQEDGKSAMVKKILFKFVLDGDNWVTDQDQSVERDQAGNLNNVRFLKDLSTVAAAAPLSDSLIVPGPTPVAEDSVLAEVSAVESTTETEAETESEAERIARLKQEEEDEETIRLLGGGMWGAPSFAVNDRIELPEHFVNSSEARTEEKEVKEVDSVTEEPTITPAITEVETNVEKKAITPELEHPVSTGEPIRKVAAVTTTKKVIQKEEDEDDAVIRSLGGGMWGAPFFKVNDPADLPEHFVESGAVEKVFVEAEVQPSTRVKEEAIPEKAAEPVVALVEEVQEVKKAMAVEEEDEDDATIRQLGGGMWGTPFFAVNDPADLPEHFIESSVVENVPVESDVMPSAKVMDEAIRDDTELPVVEEAREVEEVKKVKEVEVDEDDATIRQLGGGMWGTPFFAVNDPIELPEHFMETGAAESALSASVDPKNEAAVVKEEPDVEAVLAKEEAVQEQLAEPMVAAVEKTEEDEDDATIRKLGGGMWGAPFFAVNDRAELPEHFTTAAPAGAESTVEVAEKNVIITNSSSTETFVESNIVKDEFSTTIEGELTETVVETTEDVVVEDAEGHLLEETITTSVEDTVQGVLEESVTETIEVVEEENGAVAGATEEELDTTTVEETITFTDSGDTCSLHSITTSIKPIQKGEHVVVEHASELHIEPSSPVSKQHHVEELIDTAAGNGKSSEDKHDGDGDYGVVVLQHDPSLSPPLAVKAPISASAKKDGKPGLDTVSPLSSSSLASMEAADLPSLPLKSPAVVTPASATSPGKLASKDPVAPKKKKGLWKKIKKVLS